MLGASAWTVALPRIAFASRRDPGDSEEVPAATDSFARRPYYVDETLAEAEVLRAVLESSPDGTAVVDLAGRILVSNSNYLGLWGLSAEQLKAMSPQERWQWQRERLVLAAAGDSETGPAIGPEQVAERAVFQMRDGRWLERRRFDHRVGSSTVGQVVHWRDITELEAANRLAMYERQLMHALMDSVPDQIFFKDLESRFIRINPSLAKRYGLADPGAAIGKSDADFYSAEHAARTRADELQIMRTGLPLLRQVQLERWPDGSESWNVSTKMPLHDAHDQLIGIYGIAHDITEHKRNEALIWQQANFDALTELPNRRLLRDRWAQACSLRERSGTLLALLVLDLDGFKGVNDAHGHARGDELLVQAARRLRDCVRSSDTVARLGGDEFALLLNGLPDADTAQELAEKIVQALGQPFDVAGVRVKVSASVGVSLCPRDGEQLDELFLHSDRAMYQAKANGRNRVHWHAPG